MTLQKKNMGMLRRRRWSGNCSKTSSTPASRQNWANPSRDPPGSRQDAIAPPLLQRLNNLLPTMQEKPPLPLPFHLLTSLAQPQT
jgi:hypothetical protein